jgi:hypothetical protein
MLLRNKIVKFIGLIINVMILTACGCKASYMPENYIVKRDDKNMNCQQVVYAINETEFWIKNVNERCSRPYVFAKFIPCTPMVKLDAMRNEYTLWDRVDYLKSLYKLKGCNLNIEIARNKTIEQQAKVVGMQEKLLQEARKRSQATTNMYTAPQQNTGKEIVNIPTNAVLK